MSKPVLLALFAIGLLARLVVLALPGTPDVPDWKATSFVASSDLLGVYGHGGSPPEERRLRWEHVDVTTEYPPVSQLEMAAVGRAYRLIDPQFRDTATLTVLIKMPGLVAECLFVVVILTWGARLLGTSAAQWTALAFWLNPAIWLAGPVLGYLDAQMAVPLTLAMIAASAGRSTFAGLLAGVALLTKPQAIFAFPILGMVLLRDEHRWRWKPALMAGAAGLAVVAASLVPFWWADTLPSALRAFQRFGQHDLVSGTATNLWWVATWAAGGAARMHELDVWQILTRPATMVRISTVVGWGLPNPRTIGTGLTAVALAWAMWRARRGVSRSTACLLAAWCVLAYFMVSGQVHENHAYLAIPLLAVAAGESPRVRRIYWAVSAAFFANVYIFYGFGTTHPPLFDRRWTFVDASILLSAVYAAVVLWVTVEMIAATRGHVEAKGTSA